MTSTTRLSAVDSFAMEDPAADFGSSLRDLTTNSKPLIQMLTMLADESKAHAKQIVEVIEEYLRNSDPSIKLPCLYLIDSIVKTIGDPYTNLFTQDIVRNFVNVFQSGDEKVRASLFKLRQTWREIFPERKLYALDVNTQAVDPNWPLCASAPIHLNPKFLKMPQGKQSEADAAQRAESELKLLEQRKRELEKLKNDLKLKNQALAPNPVSAVAAPLKDPRTRKDSVSPTKNDHKKQRKTKDKPRVENGHGDPRREQPKGSKHLDDRKFRIPKKAGNKNGENIQQSSSMQAVESQQQKNVGPRPTQDLDLRIFPPPTKRRREAPAPKDEDLRIRPTENAARAIPEPRHAPEPVRTKPRIAPASSLKDPRSRVRPVQPMNQAMMPTNLIDANQAFNPKMQNLPVSEAAPERGQILLDGLMREIRFVDDVAIAIMEEGAPNCVMARQVTFQGPPKQIIINENDTLMAGFDGREEEFFLNGKRHLIRFGAPLRELFVDGVPYNCQFNGRPILVESQNDLFTITLPPPNPSVTNELEAMPEQLARLGLRSMRPAPHPGSSGDWRRYEDNPASLMNPIPGQFPPSNMNRGNPTNGFGGPPMRPMHPGGGPGGAPSFPFGMGFPPGQQGNGFGASQPMIMPGQAQAPGAPSGDLSDLLSKLVQSGIIGGSEPAKPERKKERHDGNRRHNHRKQPPPPQPKPESIPKLTLKDTAILKERHSGVIAALHEGNQCSACGQRFDRSDQNNDKYAQHLDWHFRMKRRGREGLKKAASRKWYFGVTDWIAFEEVEDLEDRTKSFFEQQDNQGSENVCSQDSQSSLPQQEVPTVPLSEISDYANYTSMTCHSCHETLEKFFCEDTEEWRLRNAVVKDGTVFHPDCYEDFLKPTPKLSFPLKIEPNSELVDPVDPVDYNSDDPDDVPASKAEFTDTLPGFDAPATGASSPKLEIKQEPGPSDGEAGAEQDEVPEVDIKMETGESDEVADPADGPAASQSPEPDDDKAMDLPAVIVEELGEFGVDSLGATMEPEMTEDSLTRDIPTDTEETRQNGEEESSSSKVTLRGSGGFVLRMKQDSVTPVEQSEDARDESAGVDLNKEVEEWRPPTPDARFTVQPTVSRGSEMSGLCSIM